MLGRTPEDSAREWEQIIELSKQNHGISVTLDMSPSAITPHLAAMPGIRLDSAYRIGKDRHGRNQQYRRFRLLRRKNEALLWDSWERCLLSTTALSRLKNALGEQYQIEKAHGRTVTPEERQQGRVLDEGMDVA